MTDAPNPASQPARLSTSPLRVTIPSELEGVALIQVMIRDLSQDQSAPGTEQVALLQRYF